MLQPPATTATILIVDDQESNLRLLERVLTNAGYTSFVSTTDPLKAVDLYRQYRPDLVVLDLHMPQLDGLGVLEQLNAHVPADAYVPVLVLTGDLSPTLEAAGALGRRQGLPRQALRSARSGAADQEPPRGPLALPRRCSGRTTCSKTRSRSGATSWRTRSSRSSNGSAGRRSSATTTRCSTRSVSARSRRASRRCWVCPPTLVEHAAARGAAARHRQDRRPGQHPAQAGQADRRTSTT